MALIAGILAEALARWRLTNVRWDTRRQRVRRAAISVSDAQNLILRDNIITNFGAAPGAEVFGIFILGDPPAAIRAVALPPQTK